MSLVLKIKSDTTEREEDSSRMLSLRVRKRVWHKMKPTVPDVPAGCCYQHVVADGC